MASAMNLAWMWRGRKAPCLMRSAPQYSGAGCDPQSTPRPHRTAPGATDQGLRKNLRSLRLLELIEERPSKGLEPSLHADLERSRARHERDGLDAKASLLEQAPVFGDGGKEPGRDLGRIAAMKRTHRPDPRGDGRHIAVTTELADEAATGLERAMH